MKKWTVMVVPNDRGERRTFELHLWHVLAAMTLVASVAAGVALRFQPSSVAHGATTLEQQLPRPATIGPAVRAAEPSRRSASAGRSASSVEARIRAEYEARDEAIASELTRLYIFEAEVREAMGMPPREESAALDPPASGAALGIGGQGGGRPEAPDLALASIAEEFAPPSFVEGVERPSADLMLQEMRVRSSSMARLLTRIKAQKDRSARTPSIVPTTFSGRTISSGFGNRRDPFTHRVRFHGGLDVAADRGAPIVASARGVVTESARDPYYGHYVKLDHGNGYETLYAHMSKRLVDVGTRVERGDEIGRVGSTGRSTSPHIHYEVIKDGSRVNPRTYLGQ